MVRIGKRVVLVAGVMALLVPGVAAARGHVSRHATEIAIQNVYLGQDGRLSVSGVLRSDSRDCRRFNNVALYRRRGDQTEVMDFSFTSFLHSAWATRTARGAVVDGDRFYVKVHRFTIITVGNRHHRRRTVCGGDRARVAVPPPGVPSSAPQ